jgi:hypothetical protein
VDNSNYAAFPVIAMRKTVAGEDGAATTYSDINDEYDVFMTFQTVDAETPLLTQQQK